LQFVSAIEARRGPEDYWKSVMKDEKMPEVITSLLNQDLADPIYEDNTFRSYFKRDFYVNPTNAIIYHPDHHHHHHHNQIPNWSTKVDSHVMNRPAPVKSDPQ